MGGAAGAELKISASSSSLAAASARESAVPGLSEDGVYRRGEAERAASAERLNLDRRGLTQCPRLVGEELLRLVNYQNNAITTISNLDNLPHLIFLDLYNNSIAEISGLEAVPTLRVLMLGKNRLTRVSGLTGQVPHLDVLDLHSNQITSIEGLDGLQELRVLNLAGNQLSLVKSLREMPALTELNLRRNKIEVIAGIEDLTALQRLFLSNNQLRSLASLPSVFACGERGALAELTLDGNPLASGTTYRTQVLERLPGLKSLDLRKVTDEERLLTAALTPKPEDPPAERSRRAQAALAAAEEEWRGASDPRPAVGATPQARGPAPLTINLPAPQPALGSPQTPARPALLRGGGNEAVQALAGSPRPGTAGGGGSSLPLQPQRPINARQPGSSGSLPRPGSGATRPGAGEPEADGEPSARPGKGYVEYDANADRLCIYGNTIESLERFASVSSVLIKFTSPSKLAILVPKLKKLGSVLELVLSSNNLESLAHLNVLGMLQLRELTVEDNPVSSSALFRPYVVFRLSSLRSVNGVAVTPEERRAYEQYFSPLHSLSLPLCTSHDPAALPVMSRAISDHMYEAYASRMSNRSALGLLKTAKNQTSAQEYMATAVQHALTLDKKLKRLAEIWDDTVREIIRGPTTLPK